MADRPSILNIIVPDFSAPMTGLKPFQLADYLGQTVVLYFYPKDNTPGCTTESLQFRDLHAEFARAVEAPKSREIFAANAAEAMKLSPEAMQQMLEQDMKTWADVVKATGVKQ